jgi:hypothetical protein
MKNDEKAFDERVWADGGHLWAVVSECYRYLATRKFL